MGIFGYRVAMAVSSRDYNGSIVFHPICVSEAMKRYTPGIDGMPVEELRPYLKEKWLEIREKLDQQTYRPNPVRLKEIEKPDGGVRRLGIPTVMDRFLQQADHTGTHAAVRTVVLRAQLRVSTRTECTPSDKASPSIRASRL